MSESDPILTGDARLLLPDSFVADVMVCDPPYRKHVHDSASSQDQHTDGGVRHNDFGFGAMTPELMAWLCQMAARVRRWSIIYTDIESVADWKRELELAGATYIRTLPWVRWSMPQLSGDRPPQGFECLVVAHGSNRGKKHWNGAGNLTHLAHLALRGNGKHKTEKPLDQLLDLVSWFSDRGTLDQGELVVDPCSGSGTTGLACKILGRRFAGCELDAEWAAKGNARIRACNTSDLPGSLSPRDSERFLRWVATSEKEKTDLVERKYNTERVRKRLEDKKLSLVTNPCGYDLGGDGRTCALSRDHRGPHQTARSIAVAEQNEEEKIMMIPHTWPEAYEHCIAECGPKTSAASRTLPLPFENEYVARDWREAYERAVAELAPPLSPSLLAKIAEKRARDDMVLLDAAVAVNGVDPAIDPDFVEPPKDDSESGFTQPNGELLPNWANPKIPDPVTGPPLFIGERVAPGEAISNPYMHMPGGVAPRANGMGGPGTVTVTPNDPKHYDLGAGCVVTTTVPASTPAPEAKRGKGRPPGVKNKAPKSWKDAMARVVAELGGGA